MITARTLSMSSSSIVPSNNNASVPNISKSHFISRSKRLTWPVITICAGSLIGVMPMLAVRALQKPTPSVPLVPDEDNQEEKGNTKGKNAGGGFNILSFAKWFLSSLVMVFPFYKNFMMIEDRIEKTATSVLHVVEEVAEVVDKVAEDVEKSLPENSSLKNLAHTVERIAEEVDKDAEVLQSLVEKVDDVVDKFDEMVEPMLEEKLGLGMSKKTKGTGPPLA